MSGNDNKLHYVHRLNYTTQERLVGLFVLAAIVLLIASLAFSRHSSYLFADKFTLHAYMQNAQGVTPETAVRVSGVEVGRVESVDLAEDNRIQVTLRILERFRDLIRTDSVASLNKLSVLGNAVIEITPGDPALPVLADSGTIPVREAASLDEMIARITPAMENLVAAAERLGAVGAQIEPGTVTAAMQDMAATTANLRDITARIRAGEGAAGRLLADEKFSADLAETLEGTLTALKLTSQRLEELRPVLDNTRDATGELPALIAESRELAAQLNVTVSALNRQVEQLPDMVLRTRALMDEAERTLRAIQNTWPVSSSIANEPAPEILPPQPPND